MRNALSTSRTWQQHQTRSHSTASEHIEAKQCLTSTTAIVRLPQHAGMAGKKGNPAHNLHGQRASHDGASSLKRGGATIWRAHLQAAALVRGWFTAGRARRALLPALAPLHARGGLPAAPPPAATPPALPPHPGGPLVPAIAPVCTHDIPEMLV